MAKSLPTRTSNPQVLSADRTFMTKYLPRNKRLTISAWTEVPEGSGAVRLRIRPQPRPQSEVIQPVVFCNFDTNE